MISRWGDCPGAGGYASLSPPHHSKETGNDQRFHASRHDHRTDGIDRDSAHRSEILGARSEPAPRAGRGSRRARGLRPPCGESPRRRGSRRRNATSSTPRLSTRTNARTAWPVTPTCRAWPRSSRRRSPPCAKGARSPIPSSRRCANFAAKVTRNRSVVSEADVSAFKAAGHNNRGCWTCSSSRRPS